MNLDNTPVEVEITSQQASVSLDVSQINISLDVASVDAVLSVPDISVSLGQYVDVPFIDSEYEQYQGSYEVTPMRAEQVLATANKVMTKDVKVKEIPYSAVSNTAGGQTFYIGREVGN